MLNILWQKSPMSASDVVAQLAQSNDWHEKTIKTLLNRLVKKQAVGFEKLGRSYLHRPLIDQSDYQLKESESFIER